MNRKLFIGFVAGLAALLAGCAEPLVDWHVGKGTPEQTAVRGAIPIALSLGAPGEEHHGIRENQNKNLRYYSEKNAPISLIEYPFP